MNRHTYSLGLIVDWAKSKNYTFTYSNPRVGFGLVNHGMKLQLPNNFELSIQTHPDIASSAFAETALMHGVDFAKILDYRWDVVRWQTPEKLFTHIEQLHVALSHEDILNKLEHSDSEEESGSDS